MPLKCIRPSQKEKHQSVFISIVLGYTEIDAGEFYDEGMVVTFKKKSRNNAHAIIVTNLQSIRRNFPSKAKLPSL